MNFRPSSLKSTADTSRRARRALHWGIYLTFTVVGLFLVAALSLPKGYTLALIGDTVQTGLVAAGAFLALQNTLRSPAQFRTFWLLLFIAGLLWLASMLIWSIYELWFRIPSPDTPFADILLFLKLVPLATAAALEPHKARDARLRTFGLLDFSILILYSLYLFAFFVYAYRLLPGATALYNFHFNLADTIGNQLLAVVAGLVLLRASGPWRSLFRIFFLFNASYAIASNLSNVAIDLGGYYTGSLYDLPLVASMAGFVCLCLAGRPLLQGDDATSSPEAIEEQPASRFTFVSSHLAMLVTLSAPAIGLWLLTAPSDSPTLFSFRLHITLLTIFLLTLLLSIKQDVLSANLVASLQHLSSTYSRIDRFKDHLVQSEKLTSLGALVASAASQMGEAMTEIQGHSSAITSRSNAESRTWSLAVKIGQYALRTDSLAEKMRRFAQDTPLQLGPVEVKPLLESALHLSRISKNANLRVELREESVSPPVLADSSQLLHVFLEIISNAMDALKESGGGDLTISISPCDPQVCIQFADTGPGIKFPEHVFEPFFTTKPVGSGTGLGLSTCYGIIRQHNGDISCGNRLEGGAHFTIFLPAAPQPLPSDGVSSIALMQDVR